jgi:hypothetical protein
MGGRWCSPSALDVSTVPRGPVVDQEQKPAQLPARWR